MKSFQNKRIREVKLALQFIRNFSKKEHPVLSYVTPNKRAPNFLDSFLPIYL